MDEEGNAQRIAEWRRRGRRVTITIWLCCAVLGAAIAYRIERPEIRTRAVFAAINRANAERLRKGVSIESAESFVAALRQIDLNGAEPGLRPVVDEYIAATEDVILFLKSGRDPSQVAPRMKAAGKALKEFQDQD